MYQKPNKELWNGRVDTLEKYFSKRWHEVVKLLPYPYNKKAGIALLGFECDEGVKRNKGRVGASKAYDSLKSAMSNFAFHLENHCLYDAGKIVYEQSLEYTQELLSNHIKKLIQNDHFPIVIGGGHEIAYASFLGVFKSLNTPKKLAILNFDAHFDIRDDTIATSGTPFSQIAAICDTNNIDFNYMCLGISQASNTQALFKKAKDKNIKYILDTRLTYKNLLEIEKKLDLFFSNKDCIYISIDADVFSAFSVPSVSAPSSRGVGLDIAYNILDYIFSNYANKIKLVDFAEFNPNHDIDDIGKKSVSRLIYDVVQLVDGHKKYSSF